MAGVNCIPFGTTIYDLEITFTGVNCVLFLQCILYLLQRQSQEGLNKLLLFASVPLPTAATLHMILAFLQLIKAFTDSAIISELGGANVYLSFNPLLVVNDVIYSVNAHAQDLLLIRRLYVVFNQNWRVCILPLIGLTGDIVCAYVGIYYFSRITMSSDNYLSSQVRAYLLSGWVLGVFLNGGLTCSIAYYIWKAGKQASSATGAEYRSAIRLVVESGALMTSCILIMTWLYIAGSVAGPIAVNVGIQINTITPLLIIVRLGTHSKGSESCSTLNCDQSSLAIDIRIDVAQSIDSTARYSVERPGKTDSTVS